MDEQRIEIINYEESSKSLAQVSCYTYEFLRINGK